MSLPGALVIGAMKSGTTTLYQDLRTHPGIFFPEDKEPGDLSSDEVLTPAGRDRYAHIFRKADHEQLCAEASTIYTKLPDFPGVAMRARHVLGPELRLIYIVRNPVHRIVSHYRHEQTRRARAPIPIDDAVRTDHRFLAYSSYAMQAQPWIDTFGRERLLVIRFEDYVADRRAALAGIQPFLGVQPLPDLISDGARFNETGVEPVTTPAVRSVARSRVYRGVIRPLLSVDARRRLRFLLLPRPSSLPEPPSRGAVDFIIERLRDDLDRQVTLFGLAGPLWTDEELREGLG